MDLVRVTGLIQSCIGKINEQLPADARIGVEPTTVLAGPGSALESITLINLIVEIENDVSALDGRRVDVLEEAVMGQDGARFATVQDLAQWIVKRVS